jgi:hypothetical protein
MERSEMKALQRITTEYSEAEDRIRLTGELENAQPVVIWVTQRMLVRLLPLLFNWLQGQVGNAAFANVMQDFAQQSAVADLSHQAPVQASEASVAWMVQSVDIAHSPEVVTLTFRSAQGQTATLSMDGKHLRQWLSTVRNAWEAGQWPMEVWPHWISEPGKVADVLAAMWH